jgi:glycosyltransferase involved in cell wall biosynthesis
MKVHHVITTLNRGGAENHLLRLVEEQVRRGLSVGVSYLKGDGYWMPALEEMGVRVRRLGLTRYGETIPAFRLRRTLAEERPDLVHAHMPPAELYARVALMGRGRIPLVVSKHNDEPFFRGPGADLVARLCARRARRIIAISGAVKRYVESKGIAPAGKVDVIHYGLDLGPGSAGSEAIRRGWGVPADGMLIGTVARLVPQKALHVLLEAFRAFSDRAGDGSRLAIVGRGPLESSLARKAGELGLGGKVIWAGFREDIPAVMAAFDVFALSSDYEGFGLVLLEAMAAGRPVVATRVSAIPEVVTDGVTGLLIPRGDASAMAEAFLRLRDKTWRESLGEAGRKRVISEFNQAAMAEKTLDLYRQALE